MSQQVARNGQSNFYPQLVKTIRRTQVAYNLVEGADTQLTFDEVLSSDAYNITPTSPQQYVVKNTGLYSIGFSLGLLPVAATDNTLQVWIETGDGNRYGVTTQRMIYPEAGVTVFGLSCSASVVVAKDAIITFHANLLKADAAVWTVATTINQATQANASNMWIQRVL